MSLDKLVELGELLAKQWRNGQFKLEKVKNKRELTIHTIEGNKTENCKNDDEVRNVICNVAEVWLEEKLALAKDTNQIHDLMVECRKLDLKSEVFKSRTGKGITVAGIKEIAEKKGYQIWREKGKTCVTFPDKNKIYRYDSSILETAKNLKIITASDAQERQEKDERFV
jgi:hypothetical protein